MIPIKIQCDCGQRYTFDVEPMGGRMPYPVTCPVCGADGTPSANAIIAQTAPSAPILIAERAVPLPAAAAAPSAQPPAPPPPMRVAVPGQSVPSAASAPPLRVAATAQPAQSAAPALRVAGLTRSAQTEEAAQPAAHAAHAVAPVQSAPRRPPVRLPGQVDRTQAEHEARAKISWGDPPKEVMGYLRMQGFSLEEAKELVDDMFRERAKTIRANGFKKIFLGIGLLLTPLINVATLLFAGIVFTYVLAATVMAAVYGAYCILKGILMVIAPKGEKGDVMEQ